ncbi:MAG TPA: hypothetical protein PLP33_14810 [Leptospiraceae bacterium]|nr:hypothetical protein [Leptospiraceae bacterium]
MSTKIYNGFEFTASRPSTRWSELLSAAGEFRALCKRELNLFIIKKTVHHAVLLLDRMDYGLIPKKTCLHWEGFEFVKKNMQQAYFSSFHHPYDYSTSLVIYPVGTKLYGQTFGRTDWINQWWLSRKDVKDFHYQDQCDKPDQITRREWTKREKVWSSIYEDYSKTPSESGLVLEIISSHYNVFDAMLLKDYKELVCDILSKISFEQRLSCLAAFIFAEENKKSFEEVLINGLHLSTVSSINNQKLRKELSYNLLVDGVKTETHEQKDL